MRQGVPRKGPSAAWHADMHADEFVGGVAQWNELYSILFSLLKVTRYIFRPTPAAKKGPGLNRQTTASAVAAAVAAADPGSLPITPPKSEGVQYSF